MGDQGCAALAGAAPSLAQLDELWLSNNRIGDGGAAALFAALGAGALPTIGDLRLQYNELGDASQRGLTASLCTGALGRAWYLGLSNNGFGDAALSELADAIAEGALPRLEFVTVEGGSTSAAHEQRLHGTPRAHPSAAVTSAPRDEDGESQSGGTRHERTRLRLYSDGSRAGRSRSGSLSLTGLAHPNSPKLVRGAVPVDLHTRASVE